jgi:uncharacterized caspase-like protein
MSESFDHGYALLVGVGESAYPRWSLPATVKDVLALKAMLTDADLCAYPDDDLHMRVLHDEQATRAALLDGLAWLEEQATDDPEATVVVFYSGHGWLDEGTGRYFLIPHDIDPVDVPDSSMPAEAFSAALRRIPARRLLAFLDCCHAEGMATAKDDPPVRLPSGLVEATAPKGLLEELKRGEGRAVFSSSGGSQRSWIRPDGSMSIYTYHLIEALQGAGNRPGDTDVRVSNLINHVGKAVPESARRAYNVEQTPHFDAAATDFPVAVLRGGKGLPAGGWESVRGEAEAAIERTALVVSQVITADRGSVIDHPTQSVTIGR